MKSPVKAHQAHGKGLSAQCAVVTLSDTRDGSNDPSGTLVEQRLAGSGHNIVSRSWVVDEPTQIREHVGALLETGLDLVVCTGGTGVAPRDQTVEAVSQLWQRDLPGFGELFRMLSFQQIGPAAMLSRACAGVSDRTAIFLLPGSPHAVELAMDRLIVPQVSHLLHLLQPK